MLTLFPCIPAVDHQKSIKRFLKKKEEERNEKEFSVFIAFFGLAG